MNVIWKFPVPKLGEAFSVDLPSAACVIHFARQQGIFSAAGQDNLAFWVVLNAEEKRRTTEFMVIGTGVEFDDGWIVCATALSGHFVWHLLERSHLTVPA